MSGFLRRSFGAAQDSITRMMYGVETAASVASFYDCADKTMNGDAVKMSQFKGDVLLLVNVASK